MTARNPWFASLLCAALFGCAGTSESETLQEHPTQASQLPSQAAFPSPEAAAEAFAAALRGSSDEELYRLLGPEAERLVHSVDPVQDQNDRETFLERYDERRSFAIDEEGVATLLVGDDEWPLPIPIVRDPLEELWRFDGPSGVEELINRRIGANELDTIEVLRATVDAQHDYRSLDPEGNGGFAQKFLSDEGRRNGLFWRTAPGEPLSPLGELVAAASEAGYSRSTDGSASPYHGYHYRMLTSQGPSAPGGARSYLEDGALTGGFGAVAWPAEYGSSGVMTFLVGRHGIVYQKDLGEATAASAAAITAFDPDGSWSIAEDEE